MDENDEPHDWSQPKNRVDAASKKHDITYRKHPNDLEAKHNADREYITELDNIPNPTFSERLERALVKK